MRKIIFFLSTIILTGCLSDKISEPDKVIKLNPDSIKEAKLSKIFSDVQYIDLSNKGASDLIGEINQVEIAEDRIYVLDAFQSITLNVYDREGTLLFNISNIGRGPGEFLGPYAFAIDEEAEEIIIYDAAGLKLCLYSLKNGDFIEEKPMEFAISKFNVINDGYVFFLNNRTYLGFSYNIIITDKDLNVIDKSLRINPNMANYQFEFPVNLTPFENKFFLTVPEYYDVYQIGTDDGKIKKRIKIDFGDRNLPEPFYESHVNNQSRFDEIGSSAHNISTYFETNDFIHFIYDVGPGGNQQYYFQSKKDSIVIHTSYDNLIDDLNIGPLPRWPIAKTGNKLVWYQDAASLLRYLEWKENELTKSEWDKFKKQNEKLLSFSKNITEDSNPYLIFTNVDLKK